MIAAAVAAVFMYHHVSTRPGGGAFGTALTVTPQELDDQLRLLRDHDCSVVGVEKLVADVGSSRARACEVSLTFDDGYDDAATQAAPMLRRYGDVGTFFVTTGLLGTPGHLSASGVRALARSGMDVEAHTITHPDLTLLAPAAVEREVRGSRAVLESITGAHVGAFAYPSGRFNISVERAVAAAGYDVAFATAAGDITPAGLARDKFALPRFRVLRGRGDALIRRVLGAAGSGGSAAPALDTAELRDIAKDRIAGNAPDVAERVAVALLSVGYPEQILKVRTYKTEPAVVAGIMLSGVKFHAPVDRQTFAADAADMIYRAFAADPSVSEVDVWAVVPIAVSPYADVSGDLAVPTNRTVFSAAVLRRDFTRDEGSLGTTYWEAGWLDQAAR
ncbi:MAG TPA: polysaccharide deacetylase family protein [Candidatus Eremiobacteraceae bacterium]|nr:polysaccharide deacetylase family protein [Candidatus Eremiobacteraceae bacterium]